MHEGAVIDVIGKFAELLPAGDASPAPIFTRRLFFACPKLASLKLALGRPRRRRYTP